MQLIIPMAGIGKRFIEAGYKDPKPLIEVDGKPMIQHVYELFNEENTSFICNEKHLDETNLSEVLESFAPNAQVYILSNKNRKGPVDAINRISLWIDDIDEVIVSYCDFGTNWNYEEFLKEARAADGAIACYTGFHPHMLGSDNYAFVQMDGNKAVKVQEKKPFTKDKMSELASNGIYYFKTGAILKRYFQKLYDQNITVGGEFYVSEVYNLMIEDGLTVVCPLIKHMLQWGTPYDLQVYQKWSDCFSYPKQEKRACNPLGTTTIIPMAGRGSRFSDVGYTTPKALLPIDGRPMYQRAIECLPISDKTVIVTTLPFSLPSKIGTIETVKINEVTKGQACTCEIGINNSNAGMYAYDPIMISACDNGALYDHEKWNELVNDKSVDVIVWSFRNNPTVKPNPDMYAWLSVDPDDNRITEVSCKKFNQGNYDPMKCHAIIGTFFYRHAQDFVNGLEANYEENITTNGEYYVDDVINQNIKSGLNVKVFEVDHYICWGTPNDYKTYNYWAQYFLDKSKKEEVMVSNNEKI